MAPEKAAAEASFEEHFERIRSNLEQIHRTDDWPSSVYDREGEHHYSFRIVQPTSDPGKKPT